MKSKVMGVGLIEVLVTLLVLSTSLLALAALQTRSLQFNHGSYLRSQANIYAYDILDRIRINKAGLGNYNVALGTFDLSSSAVTSPLAAADIDDWRRRIATNFASGKGGIKCDSGTNICTVTITWSEINSSGLPSEDATTFVYASRI